MKEEKFPNSRKPSHRLVCGEFWNLRGQHNQEGKKKERKKERNKKPQKTPQKTCLTATASREVAQTLMSSISERGLDWEAWAASSVLRVRTSPECPECHEDSLRELT